MFIRKMFLFLMIIASACAPDSGGKIHDLIQPVNLKAGQADSVFVSDIFYADDYDVSFEQNDDLGMRFDKEKNILYFNPPRDLNGLRLVKFTQHGEEYVLPVFSRTQKYFTFKFRPKKKYNSINLFGSFNGWNRSTLPMTDPDGDGVFVAEASMDPGMYEYKFFVDGAEITDPANPDSISNGMGAYNSVFKVEEDKSRKPFLFVDGFKLNKENTELSFLINTGDIDYNVTGKDLAVLFGNKQMPFKYVSLNGNKISIEIPSSQLKGEKFVRVCIGGKNLSTNMQTVILFDGKPADGKNEESTWYDAVIYSLLTDRFNDGDKSINKPIKADSLFDKANYNGGDWQGIIDKLDEGYFTELGINTIWLFPVNDNPNEAYREYPEPHRWFTGYHGYWPIDHKRVEEHFGTMETLKTLVNKAHEQNIKVLFDFVSNHVHEQHPFYKEHPEWFGTLNLPDGRKNLRFWDEFRLTTWFEPYMPSFDYLGSEEAIDVMTENAVWWLKETGADGYRHDAVKHVPNKFWRALTSRLKKEIEIPMGKKLYQIGETFGSYDLISSYVNNGQLSSQFNFNLYEVAFRAIIDPGKSFGDLDKEMKKTFAVYGQLHLMGNIMDSHDKNRFLAYADGDLELSQWSAAEVGWANPPKVDNPQSYKMAKMYYAYMFTIPGVPVVYYGSEFGMTGASDPDNRRMMKFGDQLDKEEKSMLENTSKLIHLRNNNSALRYGDFYTLKADKKFYAYTRSDVNQRILVILNKSNKTERAELILPAEFNAAELTDMLTGDQIVLERSAVSFPVKALDFRIFEIK